MFLLVFVVLGVFDFLCENLMFLKFHGEQRGGYWYPPLSFKGVLKIKTNNSVDCRLRKGGGTFYKMCFDALT